VNADELVREACERYPIPAPVDYATGHEYAMQVVFVQGRRQGWIDAHSSVERCSMCRDGISHSARCHHDEHEVCDRVAEGADAPRSCACSCHGPGDPS